MQEPTLQFRRLQWNNFSDEKPNDFSAHLTKGEQIALFLTKKSQAYEVVYEQTDPYSIQMLRKLVVKSSHSDMVDCITGPFGSFLVGPLSSSYV
jgi:hypothetical protein